VADDDNMVLYTAVYDNVNDALSDLDAVDQLHSDSIIGKYDAAVIDKENGEPHIVKRIDRPRIRVIPEQFNHGTLPRKELKEAAQQLDTGQAALIVAGEPTIEKGYDKAVTKATKVVKSDFDASADEIEKELREAPKS
jgi:hypothetical protein